MNTTAYIWLFVAWVMFGLLHSILAATSFKTKMQGLMGNSFRYYRLLYSLFAAASLTGVVAYQLTMERVILWHPPLLQQIFALAGALTGLVVMAICIKKYFLNLSGIDVLLKQRSVEKLEREGLHKLVRHPLYSGTLLFTWSVFLWSPTLANFIACFCISLYTRAGIYFEEKKLQSTFGEDYGNYRQKVPMLVPRLYLFQKI